MKNLLLTALLLGSVLLLTAQDAAISFQESLLSAPDFDNTDESNASPVYFKLYSMYGFITPGSTGVTSFENITESYKFTVNKKGYGAGLRAGAGLGFVLNEFINIGVDADMLWGSKIVASVNDGTYSSTTTYNNQITSVIPHLVLKALSNANFTIYNRTGLIVGIPMDFSYETVQVVGPDVYNRKYDYETSTALGYQTALGIQISVGDHLRLMGEFVIDQITVKPSGLSSDHYTLNGATVLDPYEVEYLDEGDYSATSPYQSPTQRLFVNSLGIGVSIAYRF